MVSSAFVAEPGVVGPVAKPVPPWVAEVAAAAGVVWAAVVVWAGMAVPLAAPPPRRAWTKQLQAPLERIRESSS